MYRNLFLTALSLFAIVASHAQSTVQVISENNMLVYVILQKPTQYFEESGNNVSFCNLAAGTYMISIANSLDANAFKSQLTLAIQPNPKTSLRIGSNMQVNTSVTAINATNAQVVTVPPPVQPQQHLHRIKKRIMITYWYLFGNNLSVMGKLAL